MADEDYALDLVAGNPWSGLLRDVAQEEPGGPSAPDEGSGGAGGTRAGPRHREWHGLPVTRPPLEWSGTVTGHPKAMVLTQGQYGCLMSLRLRFPITVVPPTQASDGPVGGVFGYTHRTVSALLRHGLIRKSAGGGYAITDNGLHAVYMHRQHRSTG
jgi:hypothetical protein